MGPGDGAPAAGGAAAADPNGAAARPTAQLPPTVYLVNRGEAAGARLSLGAQPRQAGVAGA